MKTVENSAHAAKKKQYIQPATDVESLLFTTTLLVASGMSINPESTDDQW